MKYQSVAILQQQQWVLYVMWGLAKKRLICA